MRSKYLIMLVDDHPSILEVLKTLLEWEGFRTVVCGQSIRVLKTVEEQKPDLIVLDIMMPGVNGWSILRSLRGSAATAQLPVIMMTAGSIYQIAVPGDIDLTQSPTKMLSKPFDNELLVNTVLELLKAE
jgi:CheY-like chemotaxis protein